MFDITKTNYKNNPEQCARVKFYEELCGAKTFVPNRPQYEFIKAVGTLPIDPGQPKSIFVMRSGNGTGKTSGTWNVLINIIYGNEKNSKGVYGPVNIFQRKIIDVDTEEEIDGFFNFPMYNGEFPKTWPKNIWYVSNKDTLNAVWEEAKKWLPANDYQETFFEDSKDGKTYISKVQFFSTRWTLFFKTVDQDPETYEGANISICVFDEPPKKMLFTAAIGRLRMGGIILMPATPLMNAAWFAEFLQDVDEDPDTWHQQVSIWDNCIETAGQWDMGMHGIQDKGNLHKAKIEMMKRKWDEDEIPARENGEFMHLIGVVYKSYSKYRDNIFQEFNIWVRHPLLFMYRFILDPHDRKPPAAIWIRMDEYGEQKIIREYPAVSDPHYEGKTFINIKDAGHLTIYDYVKYFMQIEAELGIPRHRVEDIIDPNFGLKRNAKSGKRVYEEWTEEAVKVQRELGYGRTYNFNFEVMDAIDEGHTIVKKLLLPTADGQHKFQINASCINCDSGMRFYSRKRQTILDEEEHGPSDKVAEKYKDFPDLIRYSAVVPWHFVAETSMKDCYTGGDYGETGISDQSQPSTGREQEKPIPAYDWRDQFNEITSRPDGSEGA